MLFGWCGAYADLPDDTLWTRNVKPDYLVAADFSPDGSKVLAVAHGGLFVYETETGNLIKLWREPYQLYGRMQYAVFSKTDSRMFVRTDSNESMWNWETEELLWSIPREKPYASGFYVWDFTGQNVIHITPFPSEPRIIYYNDMTGAVTQEKNKESNLNTQQKGCSFSDDGKYFVMNSNDNEKFVTALWDLKTDKSYTLYSGEIANDAFAFSPDGKYVAIGGDEGIVRIFDLNEEIGHVDAPRKKLVKEINIGADNNILEFTKDNNYLIISLNDWTNYSIQILRLSDWQSIASYPYAVSTLNLNNKGNIIAHSSKNLYLLKDKISTSIQNIKPDTTLYPNPTSNIVNIPFEILVTGNVHIAVYNESGVLIETLTNSIFETGNHTISYNCSNLSSGTYFCVINAGNKSIARKFLVVR